MMMPPGAGPMMGYNMMGQPPPRGMMPYGPGGMQGQQHYQQQGGMGYPPAPHMQQQQYHMQQQQQQQQGFGSMNPGGGGLGFGMQGSMGQAHGGFNGMPPNQRF